MLIASLASLLVISLFGLVHIVAIILPALSICFFEYFGTSQLGLLIWIFYAIEEYHSFVRFSMIISQKSSYCISFIVNSFLIHRYYLLLVDYDTSAIFISLFCCQLIIDNVIYDSDF